MLHLPSNHLQTANILGQTRLHRHPTFRHGSRRRYFPPRHHLRALGPEPWFCRLRPTAAAAPKTAATATIPTAYNTITNPSRPSNPAPANIQDLLSRFPARIGHRPQKSTTSVSLKTTGKTHPRCMGLGLGSLAQRHGSDPVHLLPTSRRYRLHALYSAKSPTASNAWRCTARRRKRL